MVCSSIDLLRRLRQHQEWVNRKLIDAARQLTPEQLERRFEIGQGSIMATLAHLYAAEAKWLEAIEGDSDPGSPFGLQFESLDALVADWMTVEQRWRVFYEGLTEPDLVRMVSKRSTSSGAGRAHATPLSDVLLHVSLHAQYTTAQCVNMLRRLGVSPLPDPNLITLSRLEHGGDR